MESKNKSLLILIALFMGMVEVANGFYDPGLQRWLNWDPIGEGGGINLFDFVNNNAMSWFDALGLEGKTIGPITIFYDEGNLTPAEKCGDRAHEKQHRDDFLEGFPGWQKEQRGFAAEAKALKEAVKKLDEKGKTGKLTSAEQADLQAANNALGIAEAIASDPNNAIDYWNDACKRWYQTKVPHVKPSTNPPKTKPDQTAPGTNPPPKPSPTSPGTNPLSPQPNKSVPGTNPSPSPGDSTN